MSDFKKAVEQFEKLAQELFIHENKKYTAGLLAPRFKEAANRLRHDTTINQAAFVMEQVAAKDPTREVTAQDLKELANEFYTPATDFNNEFADLLEEAKPEIEQDSGRLDFDGGMRNIEWDGAHEKAEVNLYNEESDINALVDPTLACTQEELVLVRQAAQLIDDELKGTGRVSKVSSTLKHKTPEMLLFQTSLRTASSEEDTEVFIPVELSNSEIPLFPQVMSTTEKVYTLDQSGLDSLTADINSRVQLKRAQHITGLRSAEDYEIAFRNDSMGKYSEEIDEYDLPEQRQVSLGHDQIEQVLRDAVLSHDSKYTEESRAGGRELVESTLSDLGFGNPQVSFNGDYDNGLTYQASVNTEVGKLKIIVPVETPTGMNHILLPPSQFKVAEGNTIYSLNKQAISQAARESGKLAQQVHPLLFAMSYPDLKKQLKTAAHQKQHKLAQEIINLIDEKFGDHYRNAATDDYQTWLEESIASYESRCGDCTYYVPQTSQAHNDYCNLIKTAAKNVQRDEDMEICTRSTYADLDDSATFFDSGESIKISWDD